MDQYSNKHSSNRYSSRKPIFELSNTSFANYGNEQLYRIIAKIRELEDDVRFIVEENRRIEEDNKFIKDAVVDLEYTTTFQDDQILRLTEIVNKGMYSNDPISKYQEELVMLTKKVDLLNGEINDRHKKYEKAKSQKEQATVRHIKAKEQWNSFQFQENQLIEKIDELLRNLVAKQIDMKLPPDQKIVIILEQCKQIQLQISQRTRDLNIYKDQIERQYNAQKEKRIEKQYNAELLRQRNQDYEKKKNFFKSCYNEESITGVIDDMLEKEHQLRTEISLQIERNESITEEMDEALRSCENRMIRQRAMLMEEIKVQRIQNDLMVSQRQKALQQLREVDQLIIEMQAQGAHITLENRVADSENFSKISDLQKENIQLQRQYAQLFQQVELVQQQLIL